MGSLQCSPDSLAVFKGPTSKGREGKDGGKGRESKGEGRGGEGRGGLPPIGESGSASVYNELTVCCQHCPVIHAIAPSGT